MRRKYDLKNKKNFIIVFVLAIFICFIFSYCIYRYNTIKKLAYLVSAGSVIQDEKKNYIKVDDDALLKYRWNGFYYLLYQDKKIPLGKKVLVYDELHEKMKLYGLIYEINQDGTIITHKDETKVSNLQEDHFYKIADREYLLVGKDIKSSDGFTQASHYLLIELDKLGNAKLSNHKINLKTISPTVLNTSKYQFDISSELLTYGDALIDLKKIIGSTNMYHKEDTPDESNQEHSTHNKDHQTNPLASGNSKITNHHEKDSQIEEIKNKTKMTSIVRTSSSLTQIDVDYVIYDPYNEYLSVYAEIIKPDTIEVIHLPKTETHIVFNSLQPNTEYQVNFVYTLIDELGQGIIKKTFDKMTLRTQKPQYKIEIYRISNVDNTLTYKVYLQENYPIDKVNTTLELTQILSASPTTEVIKKPLVLNASLDVTNQDKYVMGSFDLSPYVIDNSQIFNLTIQSISKDGLIMPILEKYSFKLGR